MDRLHPVFSGRALCVSAAIEKRVRDVMFLQAHSVKDKTRIAYSKAVLQFTGWLSVQAISIYFLCDLDQLLARFISILFDDNPKRGQRQTSINIYSGLEFFIPEFKPGFRASRLCVKGWDRLVPAVPPVPLSKAILYAFCGLLTEQGLRKSAMALHLCFEGYMRAMELLCLSQSDMVYPGDPRLPASNVTGHSSGCVIRWAKTGLNQFVPLSDDVLLRQVRSLGDTNSDDLLFGRSYSQLSDDLKACSTYFGHQSHHYTLHSLRHGGATNDFLSGVPLDSIILKGRWAQMRTCKRYLQAGQGLLAAASVSSSSKRLIRRYCIRYDQSRREWNGITL